MVKTTVYLDEVVALKIRQIARTDHRSQAEVIREALERFTHEAERPRIRGIGAYASGRSDVSEHAEDLLRRAARRSR